MTVLAVACRSATSGREGPLGPSCARDGVEGRLGLRFGEVIESARAFFVGVRGPEGKRRLQSLNPKQGLLGPIPVRPTAPAASGPLQLSLIVARRLAARGRQRTKLPVVFLV
eukprot:12047938-Alexandrium_andersonii.AAC.1